MRYYGVIRLHGEYLVVPCEKANPEARTNVLSDQPVAHYPDTRKGYSDAMDHTFRLNG